MIITAWLHVDGPLFVVSKAIELYFPDSGPVGRWDLCNFLANEEMIGNVLLLDFPFSCVENQNNNEMISVAGTTLSSERNGSWLTPAGLTYTFGALRAKFSLPLLCASIKHASGDVMASDLFNVRGVGIQRVTGFQFASEQALVMLRDCLGLGSLQALQTHVPGNKRLHLASQDRARHVCLHVNESANGPRGEQTDSVLGNGKMNLLLMAVTQRLGWALSSGHSNKEQTH